jgi:pantoate--beta-alanine ligase
VVVSLFVNPTQFGAGEDLDAYPRDLEADRVVALDEGADVLFVPEAREMYPAGARTTVHVDDLTGVLCGASRPGHFDGVCTVVAKLFAIVGPCRAYFGRKDAQQLAVVRRMTADLDLPVDVVGCPIVREPDGLAMSSRNVYLGAEDRRAATVLSRALRVAGDAVLAGQRHAQVLRVALADAVAAEPRVRLDYAAVVDAGTLQPVDRLERDVLVALAAFVGPARLIDNATITLGPSDAPGAVVDVDWGRLAVGAAPAGTTERH